MTKAHKQKKVAADGFKVNFVGSFRILKICNGKLSRQVLFECWSLARHWTILQIHTIDKYQELTGR